jgi:hypothetical protein
MDFKVTVIAVGLSGQKRFALKAGNIAFEGADGGFGVRNDALIALLLAHGDEFGIVIQSRCQFQNAIDAVVQMLALAHQFLRFLRVVPQAWVFGALVQIAEALDALIPVKDASSAGQCPA